MMQWKRGLGCLLAAAVLAVSFPPAVQADTSVIKSVTIKVKSSDLEVGDRLPEITIGTEDQNTSGEVYIYETSDKYDIADAEWVTSESKDMTIGEEPKMKVWLSPGSDGDTDYYFRGSYGSSNVTVSGGTYSSASRDGDDLVVTLRIKPIKGTYGAPEEAYWADSGLGKARWKKSEEASSGAYEVVLYRGNSQVTRLDAYKGTSYNFYPYMTKEGVYSFKVRTVPYTDTEKQYGKKSEWTESDEMYISKDHVSDGKGQGDTGGGSAGSGPSGSTITSDQVGWIEQGGNWYFRYPDGTYLTNNWLTLQDCWYRFDSNGVMLTGWQYLDGQWYYLKPYTGGPKGALATGWNYINGKWYFLNTGMFTNLPGGAMVTGWLTVNGKQYYLDASGAMVEGWAKIGDDYYYFHPGTGEKAYNTTIGVFVLDGDGKWVK